MIDNTPERTRPLLDKLAAHLASERFVAGQPRATEAYNFVIHWRPTDEHEHLLLVECQDLPPPRLAGCRVELTPERGTRPSYGGWLDRRGCTFISGLASGVYHLALAPRPNEQRLPDPADEPAANAYLAASETLLLQPLELTRGRLYWARRPDRLILFWQSARFGSAGSARVLTETANVPDQAPLLITVSPEHQVVKWPLTRNGTASDVRLQFEGTEDTVVVSKAWYEAGSDHIAAAVYDFHVPTLAERIEALEPVPAPRHTKEPWREAEFVASYALSGHSDIEPPPQPKQQLDTTVWDEDEIRCLYPAEALPFGVALMAITHRATGRVWHKLVALPKFDDARGAYRARAMPLGEISPEAKADEIKIRVAAASEQNLAIFRQHLDDLRKLHADALVAFDDELRQSVAALCERVENLGSTGEPLP